MQEIYAEVLLNPERWKSYNDESHRVDTNPRFNTEGFIFLQITFFKTKFLLSIMSYTGLQRVQKHNKDISYVSFFNFILTNKLV